MEIRPPRQAAAGRHRPVAAAAPGARGRLATPACIYARRRESQGAAGRLHRAAAGAARPGPVGAVGRQRVLRRQRRDRVVDAAAGHAETRPAARGGGRAGVDAARPAGAGRRLSTCTTRRASLRPDRCQVRAHTLLRASSRRRRWPSLSTTSCSRPRPSPIRTWSSARRGATSCGRSCRSGAQAIESDLVAGRVRDAGGHVPAGGAHGAGSRRRAKGAISLIWEASTEADLAGYLVMRAEAPGAPAPADAGADQGDDVPRHDRGARRALRLHGGRGGHDRQPQRRRRTRWKRRRGSRSECRARGFRWIASIASSTGESKRHAAERAGRLCLLDGDLFGEYRLGEEIAEGDFPRDLPAGVAAARARACRRRSWRSASTTGPRRRAEQAAADRADASSSSRPPPSSARATRSAAVRRRPHRLRDRGGRR